MVTPNPHGTQKSRSNLIFLIVFSWPDFSQMAKSWAALLSKQDEGLLSSIEASWAERSAPPNRLITLKFNGLETWFPHCFPLFPHQNDYFMFKPLGLYPMWKNIPRVRSHSSVQGSDFGQYLYPVQILPHMLQYSMVFHAKYHPSTSHPVKRW